ncbi:Cellobiose phosphotransferase system YdjC-like protein [Klebsiella aerogenes]|nr:Cellobiose phosphotransferase system YdjC-like protein [Klebsiella aerogenes]
MAEEDSLPLDEIAHELECQYRRFIELFGCEPTHIDSHHHVHMIAQIYPIVAAFAREKGRRFAYRSSGGGAEWPRPGCGAQ